MDLCSAELFNQKYMIPCDPVHYLDQEYGAANWRKPMESKYEWKNVAYNSIWSDSEWPHAVKYFDRAGNLIVQKIKNYINKFLANRIQTVPPDLD